MNYRGRSRKVLKQKKTKRSTKSYVKRKFKRKTRKKPPHDKRIITVTKSRHCIKSYEHCHDKFLNYTEIMEFLSKLQTKYKDRVQVQQIGKTTEERPIMMVAICEPSNQPKLITFIEAGSNGRDWLSVSSALILIDYVAKNVNSTKLMDYLVVPCSNPDAYEHCLCKKDKKTNVSMNLSLNTQIILGMEDVRSIPDDIFMSAVQVWKNNYKFGAPETKAIENVIKAHRVAIKLFISFQEGGEKIVYPYGCCSPPPSDHEDLCKVAKSGQSGICYRCFEIGTIHDVCGLTFGTFADSFRLWFGMKFVYVIHMNGENQIPDTRNILPYGMDMVKCVKMMIRNVYMHYNKSDLNKKCGI